MMRGPSAEALDGLGAALRRVGTQAEAAVVGAQLFGVAGVFRTEPALRRVLTDAAVEGDAKAALATSVFGSSLDQATLKLVTDAVRRRWTRGGDLADACEELAVTALVRSEGAQGQRVGDELFAVSGLIDANPELRSALADPARSAADRRALLGGLLEGRTLSATDHLVGQSVASTEGAVTTVLARFQKIAAAARDELVAVVHTARELSAGDQERLSASLGRQYATTVHLHVVIDQTLVGGLKVEIGDDVIDGSVSSRLDEARRKLAG